jgi:hypothetical protein
MNEIPYSFWCSNCKVKHPGECATLTVSTPKGPLWWWPKVGDIYESQRSTWMAWDWTGKQYKVMVVDDGLNEVICAKLPLSQLIPGQSPCRQFPIIAFGDHIKVGINCYGAMVRLRMMKARNRITGAVLTP